MATKFLWHCEVAVHVLFCHCPLLLMVPPLVLPGLGQIGKQVGIEIITGGEQHNQEETLHLKEAGLGEWNLLHLQQPAGNVDVVPFLTMNLEGSVKQVQRCLEG